MQELLRFVEPRGPLPEVMRTGPLLIIGSACCVWDDLSIYDAKHGDQDRMGINDMMSYYPGRLQHGATLHPDKLPFFAFNQFYKQNHIITHSHLSHDWVKNTWPLKREGGTSGLFGAVIGLLMGYDPIILAGIPCDSSRRFFDPPDFVHPQFARESVFQEWRRFAPYFEGRVRSLSGRTRDFLGEP